MDPWETPSPYPMSLGSACEINPPSVQESPEKHPPHWDSSLTSELSSDKLNMYELLHCTTTKKTHFWLTVNGAVFVAYSLWRTISLQLTIQLWEKAAQQLHTCSHTSTQTHRHKQKIPVKVTHSQSCSLLHWTLCTWVSLAWMLRWRDGSSREKLQLKSDRSFLQGGK